MTHRLTSLWDIMKKFHMDAVLQNINGFVDSHYLMIFVDSGDVEPTDGETVRRGLDQMDAVCRQFDLPVTLSLVAAKKAVAPTTSAEMHMLWIAMQGELKTKLFIFVPPPKAEYYDRDNFLAPAAAAAFPKGAQQLRDAGNAYSVSLVFCT